MRVASSSNTTEKPSLAPALTKTLESAVREPVEKERTLQRNSLREEQL